MINIPSFLIGYEELYKKNKRGASLQWFKDAKFGLFLHYGLYSLLGEGEWVMYRQKISVADYEKLKSDFSASSFDADKIVDIAFKAGMKYINITTKHHDSFCLFDTKETGFNSVNSPAKRDLVAELATACCKRGLGLFLYYSYGADWRHPYFHSSEDGVFCARPPYDKPDPSYQYKTSEDFKIYMDFVHNQLTELLTKYGSIAGIWFDLISAYYFRPDLFDIAKTYKLIRELQPHCLISFKQGATGDEDFMSQENHFVPLHGLLTEMGASPELIKHSEKIWEINKHKWNEICTIMQYKGWGYVKGEKHRNADDIIKMLANAAANQCNLLLNCGLMPDGSVHEDDYHALIHAGKIIAEKGFPSANHDTGAVAPLKVDGVFGV